MSVDGDALRRLAEVVDEIGETAVDVDSARLLEAGDETIHGQLTVTVPTEGDLEIATIDTPTPDEVTPTDTPSRDDRDEQEADAVDEPDEPVDEEEPSDEYWCERCGYGPSSEAGVNRHIGLSHSGSPSALTTPPDDVDIDDQEEDGGPEADDDLTTEKVFNELVGLVESDDREWVKASEIADRLGTSGQKVGHRLGVLKSEGKVEKHDQNAAALWRSVSDDPKEGEPDEASDVDDGEDPFITASRKARQNDSGTSTEDDTPAQKSESESESEARSVDLEEDAADHSPDQDAGDDVHVDADHEDKDADEQGDVATDDVEGDENESKGFPRDCHCGATLEDSLELAVHRTEVHGVPQGTLDHLEPGEFEDIVRDAATLQDILDATGWSPERTLRALGVYGLADVVGPDGIELSDLDDYEFEGIDQPTDSPDPEADVVDESKDPSPRPVANDGGAVAFQDYSASSGTGRRCQNCGAHVDKQFARVFEPEHEGAPRACPNCEDLVREGDGTIRQKRTGGGA